MTLEEMKAVAEKVAAALCKELRTNAEVLEFDPGESVPIAFEVDGVDFVLSLDVL